MLKTLISAKPELDQKPNNVQLGRETIASKIANIQPGHFSVDKPGQVKVDNPNTDFDGGLEDDRIPGITNNEAIFPSSEGPTPLLASDALPDISSEIKAIEDSLIVVGDSLDNLTGEVIETSAIQTRSGSSDFIKKEVFNSGKLVVGESGEVTIDYLFNGGDYKGQLAVFSLEGIDELEIRSYEDFVKEASRRALSNSELGYVVLDDRQDGTYFDNGLGLRNHNKNTYQGSQTVEMNPGDEIAFMLVPNGRVKEAFKNPNIGGDKRPLFFLFSDNEKLGFPVGKIADITGDGKIFGFEDVKVDTGKGNGNYGDVVFQIEGEVSQLNEVINPNKDWRSKPLFNKLEDVLKYQNLIFDGGKFAVDETGEVKIDYLFDGGGYQGELGIFSLEGLEEKSYQGFVKEAASRALSNSELGYIAIRDPLEGAKFEGRLGERNFNSGDYLGVKTFGMNPGDNFAFIFVPDGSIEGVFNNPKRNGPKGALFYLVTEDPDDEFRPGQIGDVTGEGIIFAFEDKKVSNENIDRDYNDFVFSVNGVEDASEVVVDLDDDSDDSNDYTQKFTGTSPSTPFVAAGIGLMLETNSNLTVRDVQQILLETANQNDPTDGDWVENSAGHLVNHKYGFGAINFEDAVEMAKDWTPVNKGELSEDGETVSPGATVLAEGEDLVWTPDALGDALKALTVKAFDGKEYSDNVVEVAVAVATPPEPYVKLGDELQVNTYTNSNQNKPEVAALADGGFVVTWGAYGQDGSGHGVYTQRYDHNGKPVGEAFTIYNKLLAASDGTDTDADTIVFQIEESLSRTLAKNGKTVALGETILSKSDRDYKDFIFEIKGAVITGCLSPGTYYLQVRPNPKLVPFPSRKPRYQFRSEELEELESETKKPLPKVADLPDGIKRHRYKFTSKEIEEFEPDLKI